VDERFWRPRAADGIGTRAYLLAVGAEARDYPTLVRALAGLDVDAELAIGTSVLGHHRRLFGSMLRGTAAAVTHVSHARVTVHQQLSHRELRRLYAGARFVVVPLLNVDFDAGVTTITEAMAMGKAVVVTRTGGQVDIVRHGDTGLYVPPGDPVALRAALSYLLDNPAEAERMGRAGRAMVEARHTLDGWVKTVVGIVAGDG
jgi:glycosyltransferase involved in cell wall biosynthesis